MNKSLILAVLLLPSFGYAESKHEATTKMNYVLSSFILRMLSFQQKMLTSICIYTTSDKKLLSEILEENKSLYKDLQELLKMDEELNSHE